MLRIRRADHESMIRHALDGVPNEVCGLLAGRPSAADVEVVYPCRNAAESPVIYEVDSLDLLKADRDAEGRGLQITGVYHSHTHTEAYPSPTDLRQAPDPEWHYVLVSLQDDEPVTRSYRIIDNVISEEPFEVTDN
jgi:proteasome lid subunit RPN8/RPN11